MQFQEVRAPSPALRPTVAAVPARGGLWPRLQAPGYISVSPRPARGSDRLGRPPRRANPALFQPLGPPLIFSPRPDRVLLPTHAALQGVCGGAGLPGGCDPATSTTSSPRRARRRRASGARRRRPRRAPRPRATRAMARTGTLSPPLRRAARARARVAAWISPRCRRARRVPRLSARRDAWARGGADDAHQDDARHQGHPQQDHPREVRPPDGAAPGVRRRRRRRALAETISIVFDKAIWEPGFCAMYADVCLRLSKELPEFPAAERRQARDVPPDPAQHVPGGVRGRRQGARGQRSPPSSTPPSARRRRSASRCAPWATSSSSASFIRNA